MLKVDLLESEPFLTLGVLLDKDWSLLDNLTDWSLLLGVFGGSLWILSDGLVGGSVVVLEGFSLEFLLPSAELLLEGHWVFFLEEIVVLLDVDVAVVVVEVEVVEEVTQMAAKVRQMEMPQLHDL